MFLYHFLSVELEAYFHLTVCVHFLEICDINYYTHGKVFKKEHIAQRQFEIS